MESSRLAFATGYGESKKKKRKKANDEGDMDFPAHEKFTFREVFEAPPELAVIPKALKTLQNASQQRLRLQACTEISEDGQLGPPAHFLQH
ncbi:hypothetical protein BT93_E0978 [Corymbia citriodora subsp. variegata]|nr:hypothetical protein BT93_E0978 [Corymbia citriodora subsp. variegata]